MAAEGAKADSDTTLLNKLRPDTAGHNLVVKVPLLAPPPPPSPTPRTPSYPSLPPSGVPRTQLRAWLARQSPLVPKCMARCRRCMPMRSRLAVLCTQVLENKPVQTRQGGGRAGAPAPRVSECLVGDESGTMYFTARNEQGAHLEQSLYRTHRTSVLLTVLLWAWCLCRQLSPRCARLFAAARSSWDAVGGASADSLCRRASWPAVARSQMCGTACGAAARSMQGAQLGNALTSAPSQCSAPSRRAPTAILRRTPWPQPPPRVMRTSGHAHECVCVAAPSTARHLQAVQLRAMVVDNSGAHSAAR